MRGGRRISHVSMPKPIARYLLTQEEKQQQKVEERARKRERMLYVSGRAR